MSIDIIIDQDLQEIPIPDIKPVEGWKSIPIVECGEKLFPLTNISPRIVTQPKYFQSHIPGSLPELYLRKSVAAKLVEATKLLPEDISLLVWDAWRPTRVQKHLFDSLFDRLKWYHSNLNPDELTKLTQIYVSLPSVDPLKPSPHYTGGAVDLSLIDLSSNPLPMGTEFDHFGLESATRFYEMVLGLSKDTMKVQSNRRLLYRAMIWSGFSNYSEEWWHYDYGNQFDAIRTGKKYAIYGGITPEGGDNHDG